jgi:peptidoglycan/xylan/chitin deacetylase (PgdA/CDA1 family)
MRVKSGRLLFWTLTLGSMGLALLSVFSEPPPLWAALSLMVVYVGFATLGVLIPRLEVYGDVFWRGPPGERGIVLTFADGPHPESTPKILDILESRGALATFFVVGRKVRQYPEVTRQIVEKGHSLGLHGYEHERLYSFKTPRAVADDVKKTQQAIFEVCGKRPNWLRPPVGFVSHRTASGAKRAGVKLIAWSTRGYDGRPHRSPDLALRQLARGLTDGAIVLLHDAAERENFRPVSLEILADLLDRIEEKRLTVRRLEEWLEPAVGRQATGNSTTNRAPGV